MVPAALLPAFFPFLEVKLSKLEIFNFCMNAYHSLDRETPTPTQA